MQPVVGSRIADVECRLSLRSGRGCSERGLYDVYHDDVSLPDTCIPCTLLGCIDTVTDFVPQVNRSMMIQSVSPQKQMRM